MTFCQHSLKMIWLKSGENQKFEKEEFEKVGYVFKENQNGRQEVRLTMEKFVSMFL